MVRNIEEPANELQLCMHHLFDRDSLPTVLAPYVALVDSSDSILSVHVFGPAAECTAQRSASRAVDQPLTLELGKTRVGRAGCLSHVTTCYLSPCVECERCLASSVDGWLKVFQSLLGFAHTH